jgi:uncharacterized protein HemY
MIKVLFGLLFIVIGAGLGFTFIEDSGYVLLVWHNTSVEMSLVLAIILSIMSLVSVLVLLEILLGTLGSESFITTLVDVASISAITAIF